MVNITLTHAHGRALIQSADSYTHYHVGPLYSMYGII